MVLFDDLKKQKHRDQERLIKMTSDYLIKWIKTVEGETKSLREFQMRLFEVAKMDAERKRKEASRFKRWCEKRDYACPEKLLRKVVDGYIQLMTYNNNTHNKRYNPLKVKVDLQKMLYKSLRRVAKYYYENPKASNRDVSPYVISRVTTIIEDMMPFNTVLEWMEKENERGDDSQSFIAYNYDHDHENNNDNDNENHKRNRITLSSSPSGKIKEKDAETDDRLRYISSDEIVNEYYQSDSEKEREHLKESGQNEENNVKVIDLKK